MTGNNEWIEKRATQRLRDLRRGGLWDSVIEEARHLHRTYGHMWDVALKISCDYWFEHPNRELMMTKPYPVIRNSNYQTPDNDRAEAVLAALRLVDQGCVDCDLLGAMDDLEATLAQHATDDSEYSRLACLAHEDAVADAVQTINEAFDKGDE
jgi:hypothetical protein